jgi:hypothetical protein
MGTEIVAIAEDVENATIDFAPVGARPGDRFRFRQPPEVADTTACSLSHGVSHSQSWLTNRLAASGPRLPGS